MVFIRYVFIGICLFFMGCGLEKKVAKQNVNNNEFNATVYKYIVSSTANNFISIEVVKTRFPDYTYHILGAESADSAHLYLDDDNTLTVEIYAISGLIDSTFVFDLNYVDTIIPYSYYITK